jgi:hypothetical protein
MKDRKVKQVLSRSRCQWWEKRVSREGVYVYENRIVKPVEIVLRRGRVRGDEGEG